MFGVDSTELLVIVLIAVVVIGPKDLPRVMGSIGKWVGKARGMANQFKSGVNDMVRDSEIAELEKKWREQNDAIMRAHPLGAPDTPLTGQTPSPPAQPDSGWGLPPVPEASANQPETRPAPPAPAGGEASAPTPGRIVSPVEEHDGDIAPSPQPSVSVAPRRPAPRGPVAP